MWKAAGEVFGFFMSVALWCFKFIWDAHVDLIKNIFLPRGVIIPTLKEKESTKKED